MSWVVEVGVGDFGHGGESAVFRGKNVITRT